VENLIDELKTKSAPQQGPAANGQKGGDSAPSGSNQALLDRLDRLEHQLTDMNEKLQRIETSLPSSKSD
jgi:hypothetical protein